MIYTTRCLMDLPPELVFRILDELAYKDLLSCSLVCKALHDVISSSTSIQYKIELAISGLEDNVEHPLRERAKLLLLRDYLGAWARVPGIVQRKSNTSIVSIEEGPAWELAGGVLGQSVGHRTLQFHQLGSKLRGVLPSTWNFKVDYDVRDFTMDPSQDIFVALRAPRAPGGLHSVTLLSLSSGKPHPLARAADLPLPFSEADNFEIRVNGPLVGLLVMHALNGGDGTELWSPLRVWNWNTGQQIFQDAQEYVCSFVWLSDKYILLAHMIPPAEHGALSVIELSDTTEDTHRKRWTFLLPHLRTDYVIIESMELLSDPAPQWTPSSQHHPTIASASTQTGIQASSETSQSQPPFYIARDERIVVLMMTVMDERSAYLDPYTIRFTISTSKLLDIMQRPSHSDPIPWSAWGPQCTRAEPKNDIWDGSWPCCVYGTKIIAETCWVEHHDGRSTRYRPVSLNHPDHDIVMDCPQIYDFNQNALKHALIQEDLVGQFHQMHLEKSVDYQDVKPLHLNGFDYYLQPTHLPSDFSKFFDDPDNVRTSLPYRVCRTQIAPPREDVQKSAGAEEDDPEVTLGNVSSVMLSEDSIVLVREWAGGNAEVAPDFLVIDITK